MDYNILQRPGFYAGIGSRRTPSYICSVMEQLAAFLETLGHTLRSGGASGADSAFELGCNNKQIFLPWDGFQNKRHNPATGYYCITRFSSQLQIDARLFAKQYHNNWYMLSQGAQQLHTRNSFQVLGMDLHTPAAFVICWTKDAKYSGGTGQALRIASHLNIPIFNLADPRILNIFKLILKNNTGVVK